MISTSQKLYILLVKRTLGFLGALVAIVILSPVFFVLACVLHYANKGAGIFFSQARIGRGEKVFYAYKFKTMTDEHDALGRLLPDAERLTPIGRFMRSTSIDELPQLFNILKGDMAFIGPRPLLRQYLPLYNERQHHRHDVKPGISGWAQIHGRNNITWQHRFELDLWYVEHVSFLTDVYIFFSTIYKVFARKDINQVDGTWATMEPFNGNN